MKTFTLIAALLFAPVAFADTTPTKTTDTTSTTTTKSTDAKTVDAKTADAKPAKLAKNELQVLAHLHAVNQMEIDLGKTAKRVRKNDAVKQYGEMLVKDHTDGDKQLMALAKKHGQTIPAEKPMSDAEKQDKADAKTAAMKLKKLKGNDFDTAFIQQMITDHEKELAKADAKLAEVQDSDVADALRAVKPTLQMHADHAREVQKNLSTNTSMVPSSPTTTSAKR
jgi:putative membrane protein